MGGAFIDGRHEIASKLATDEKRDEESDCQIGIFLRQLEWLQIGSIRLED